MGTSNFGRLNNASKYYTVFMNVEEKYVECNECNEKFHEYEPEYETAESEHYCGKCGSDAIEFKEEYRSVESWEIDDWKSYFRECLENVGGTYDEEVVHDRNRPVQYLGYFQQSKFYGEEEFTVRLRMYYHVGYYEGANLDYDIEIDCGFGWEKVDEELWNGSKVTIEDIVTNIFKYSDDLPAGMQKIQSKNAMKWIEKVKAETSEKIENLFSEVCDNKLELIGTASNGESFYKEVK